MRSGRALRLAAALEASVSATASRVQAPLNVVTPLNPGREQELVTLLTGLDALPVNPVHEALKRLNTVHFAQFLPLEDGTRLGVFTVFDDDFDDYILSFV